MEVEECAPRYGQALELPTSSFANTRAFHPRPDKFEPVTQYPDRANDNSRQVLTVEMSEFPVHGFAQDIPNSPIQYSSVSSPLPRFSATVGDSRFGSYKKADKDAIELRDPERNSASFSNTNNAVPSPPYIMVKHYTESTNRAPDTLLWEHISGPYKARDATDTAFKTTLSKQVEQSARGYASSFRSKQPRLAGLNVPAHLSASMPELHLERSSVSLGPNPDKLSLAFSNSTQRVAVEHIGSLQMKTLRRGADPRTWSTERRGSSGVKPVFADLSFSAPASVVLDSEDKDPGEFGGKRGPQTLMTVSDGVSLVHAEHLRTRSLPRSTHRRTPVASNDSWRFRSMNSSSLRTVNFELDERVPRFHEKAQSAISVDIGPGHYETHRANIKVREPHKASACFSSQLRKSLFIDHTGADTHLDMSSGGILVKNPDRPSAVFVTPSYDQFSV